MERHLGRYLTTKEVVHHKNGDTGDNRIENLEMFLPITPKHRSQELRGNNYAPSRSSAPYPKVQRTATNSEHDCLRHPSGADAR